MPRTSGRDVAVHKTWLNLACISSTRPSTRCTQVCGIGNVALDCARVLLRGASGLAKTDVAGHALDALSRSAGGVQEVHLVARRGPVQVGSDGGGAWGAACSGSAAPLGRRGQGGAPGGWCRWGLVAVVVCVGGTGGEVRAVQMGRPMGVA